MERETVGRKRRGRGCSSWRWEGPPLSRGQAGRGSPARVKSSKCLEIQAWKPEMHTARRPGEFGQSGFLAALGLFFSAQERQPQRGFSALPCGLKGFAPHPSAGSRTGTTSEPGCTLLSHKTVHPPFPSFSPPDYKPGAVVWDLANRQPRSGSEHCPSPGTSPLTLLARNEIG